jgi:ubiquinone/menaquinone biosynthesis C-methylase UbiE
VSSSNSTRQPVPFLRDRALALLHGLVAIPAIYDFVQWLGGAAISNRILREEFGRLPAAAVALDVGGGTGRLRPLLPPAWKYTCADLDPQKLAGFRAKFPQDAAVQASATHLPFPDGAFDVAILCAVSHHLADEELAPALAEISRVLKPDGRLLFLDALRRPDRLRSRLLWGVDRGSHPRTIEQLRDAVGRQFRVERELRYQIHHAYVLWTLQKRPPSAIVGAPGIIAASP